MTNYNVVTKLIGPICPVGETNTDEARLKNLKDMIELTDRLLFDIGVAATFYDRHEVSVARAGKQAAQFLKDTKEAL